MEINRIYKPKKFDSFTIVPNAVFRIKGITMGATGLYAYLFSHDTSKPITIKYLIGHFKDNYQAIANKIAELEKYGLLKREEVRVKGRFAGYNYYLDDLSQKTGTDKTDSEKHNQNNILNNNISINSTAYKSIEHFIKLFPEKYRPNTNAKKLKWIDTLDKVERLDKYNLRDVYKVCKKLRHDSFWSGNFLTILKLRTNDKNGIKYIDRFMEQFNEPLAYKKIKGLKNFYLYNEDNEMKLGAETETKTLNEFNLRNVLTIEEFNQIYNHVNEKSNKKF
jgi:hypothetical protein